MRVSLPPARSPKILESHITGLFFNVVPNGLDGVANQADQTVGRTPLRRENDCAIA